ncbi:MAG: Ig-like domain-containing protein [Limisphaerales bacterium]
MAALALVAAVGAVNAQTTTNLFPNGNFSAGGPTPDWVEVFSGGSFVFTYPASGGNPGGYGVIDNTGGSGWGLWVGGADVPLDLATLGLSANFTYTFVQDMKIVSGTDIGGIKIESWGPSGKISDSGDMRPSVSGHNTANWETYTFPYTIDPAATGLKIVPLWGPNSSVAYDNIGVIVPVSSPLAAAITYPANGSTISTNFTINATASVLPGAVTNVYFYDGATLLGNDETAPYGFSVTGASVGTHALKVVARADSGNSVTSAVVNVTVTASLTLTTIYVDPLKGWVGFMNVFETPQNGGAPVFNSAWGTADLCASFSGSGSSAVLTLSPNKIGDSSAFWYVTTNSPSEANKSMDATMYVQPVGSLPGQLVTFTGTCLSNSLVSNTNVNPAGNGWTCVAFIKDFAPDYSSVVVTNVPLTNGAVFSVTLLTVADPARHVQYGFETVGPCVWPADPVLPNYGNVVIKAISSTNFYVDPSKTWVGYMNVFNLPGSGTYPTAAPGPYQFGSGWGTADLVAIFSGFGLTLSPNTIGDPSSYWYTPSGMPGAVGNKITDASMYVELPVNSVPGQNVIFSGTVLSNSLVSLSNTNAAGNGWTCVAFIKDYAPDYSSSVSVTAPMTAGAFNLSLVTINNPARHVQYGFETVGPCVWPTDPALAGFGKVVINSLVAPPKITPSVTGGTLNLSFPTHINYVYTVQYKTNLTDVSWNTLTMTNGTGLAAVVTTSAGNANQFYRLSIHEGM